MRAVCNPMAGRLLLGQELQLNQRIRCGVRNVLLAMSVLRCQAVISWVYPKWWVGLINIGLPEMWCSIGRCLRGECPTRASLIDMLLLIL